MGWGRCLIFVYGVGVGILLWFTGWGLVSCSSFFWGELFRSGLWGGMGV